MTVVYLQPQWLQEMRQTSVEGAVGTSTWNKLGALGGLATALAVAALATLGMGAMMLTSSQGEPPEHAAAADEAPPAHARPETATVRPETRTAPPAAPGQHGLDRANATPAEGNARQSTPANPGGPRAGEDAEGADGNADAPPTAPGQHGLDRANETPARPGEGPAEPEHRASSGSRGDAAGGAAPQPGPPEHARSSDNAGSSRQGQGQGPAR